MVEVKRPFSAIVIGTSWGGLDALRQILDGLPKAYPLPILIVQHRHDSSRDLLSFLLQEITEMRVKEAESFEKIHSGTIYVAPANYHLLVERNKKMTLSIDDLVHYSRPSIDVLFETAADTYQRYLVGILLTGASRDGATGLQRIKTLGGYAVVQDPDTAKADTMPRAAIRMKAVDLVLSLSDIAKFIKNATPMRQYDTI